MNSWIKNTIGIVSVFTILLLVISVGSIFMLKDSLPDYDGQVFLKNVIDEIEIYRDDYAVSYINAKSEFDAYFALGYVHAQERLFQMDLSRRAGEGRLSEILGSKTIFYDKMFRTIGINKIVHENYQDYDDKTKSMLIAYSNGINEFIKNSPDKLTIEFDILGYKPELWKPENSLLIAKLMAC